MKTAIVYYSMGGNCALIAEKVAAAIGADAIRIEPKEAYPDRGAAKFLRGGSSALKKDEPELKAYEFDASAYDRVIFGMPVWAGRVTPPLRTFIAQNAEALRGKRLAAFACSSSGSAEKPLRRLAEVLGIERFEAEASFIDPKSRPSEENDRRLARFIEELG